MSLTTRKIKKQKKENEKIAYSPSKDVYLNEDENEGEKVINGEDFLPFFDMSKKNGIRALYNGGTGSGKSYLARKTIENIKPEKVYIFSSVDDGDYDKMKCSVIKVDLIELMNKSGADVHKIFEHIEEGAVLVFDDIISFGDKLSKPYLALRQIALQKARHKNISVLVCEQTAQAGNTKGSREVLLNCQYFFCPAPKNNQRAFTNLAKIYLGLSKENIEHCMTLGRYVMINKHYPSYYVSPKEVGMF